MQRLIALVVMIAMSSAAAAWSTVDDWAAIVVTQLRARQPLPALSSYGAGLDLASAYAVQRQVIDELSASDKIVGYRASLTRPLGQVRFKVREPVTSVILSSGLLHGAITLHLREFKHLMIASALGFVLKSAVERRITDLKALAPLVVSVMPVVDFGNLDFEREANMRGEDLAAANGGFAGVLLGKPLASNDADLVNGVIMELYRGSEVIDRGRAVNVMGNQYTALYWMINRLLDQGWKLPAGTLLVTGPLSDPVPATPGQYVARFWDAADVAFTVE